MPIEQAIFTSATGNGGSGYRLVATSAGIDTAEAQELTSWGPSHDSLVETGPTATSINFHCLSSGRYCVSKSSHAGSEYSGRGGWRVYTQSLVIGREDFARFANNPFAVLRAAAAQGRTRVLERVGPQLDPIRLSGKTPAVDHAVLGEAVASFGSACIAALVDQIVQVSEHSDKQILVVGDRQRQQLITAALNCLPIECRREVSFTTGLRPSGRRPFRIACLADDSADVRRLARTPEVSVLRIGGEFLSPPVTAWGRYVLQELAQGTTHGLGSQLALSREQLTLTGLKELAISLVAPDAAEHVPSSEGEIVEIPDETYPRLALVADRDAESEPELSGETVGSLAAPSASDPSATATAVKATAPSTAVRSTRGESIREIESRADHASEFIETVELLDDLVFAALGGDDPAFARLQDAWPSALARWGSSELQESREHYARRALANWRQLGQSSDETQRARAARAIEVVCTLFGE